MRRAQHRTVRGARARLAPALIAALAGCASDAPHSTTVLAKVPERIVILPLNVTSAIPAELREGAPAVRTALEKYLQAQGSQLKTVSLPAARGLWAAALHDAQIEQQKTQRRLEGAVGKQFVARLREHAEFDAVIFPSLFVQRAPIAGTHASWDGVEREIAFEEGRQAAQLPEDAPIEGVAPAASLHVVVFDGEGKQLHEKQAGLVLLVRARISRADDAVSGPSFTFVPRRDAFGDAAALREGVAIALDPFLPAADADAPPHDERRRSRN